MDEIGKKNKKIPCNICGKNIRGNAKAVCCDVCDKWIHIKCNSISPNRYDELCDEENDKSFYCIKCFNPLRSDRFSKMTKKFDVYV